MFKIRHQLSNCLGGKDLQRNLLSTLFSIHELTLLASAIITEIGERVHHTSHTENRTNFAPLVPWHPIKATEIFKMTVNFVGGTTSSEPETRPVSNQRSQLSELQLLKRMLHINSCLTWFKSQKLPNYCNSGSVRIKQEGIKKPSLNASFLLIEKVSLVPCLCVCASTAGMAGKFLLNYSTQKNALTEAQRLCCDFPQRVPRSARESMNMKQP